MNRPDPIMHKLGVIGTDRRSRENILAELAVPQSARQSRVVTLREIRDTSMYPDATADDAPVKF